MADAESPADEIRRHHAGGSASPDGPILNESVLSDARDDPVAWAEQLTTIDGEPIDYSGVWRFWKEPLRAVCSGDTPNNHFWNFARGLGKTEQAARAKWFMATTNRLLDAIYSTPRMRQIRTFQKTVVRRMVQSSRGDPPILRRLLDAPEVRVQRNDLKATNGPGSVMEARTAWNDGNQLQGYRGQFGIGDEFQQWTTAAVENFKNAVDKGLQKHLFVGTPNFEGTVYSQYWDESDQREWFFECRSCSAEQTVTMDSVRLVDTNPETWERHCKRCGSAVTKDHILRAGYWKPTNKDGIHRGYHASQLISPRHELDRVMREHERPTTPEGDFVRYRLARFYSGAAKPIPEQAIQRVTDPDRALLYTGLDDYAHYLGVDFGGGEGSDTVAVVIHVLERDESNYPTKVAVDYVEIVDTDTRTEERAVIADIIDRFGVHDGGRAVLDMGYGSEQVGLLQNGDQNPNEIPKHGWGSVVLGHHFGSADREQSQWEYLILNRDNTVKAYKPPWCNRVIRLFPDTQGYDDTSHSDEVGYTVSRVSEPGISIPYADDPDTRETIDYWTDHLTAVKREYKETQRGQKNEFFTTFSPSQKDDGFLALVYAYTAATIGGTSTSSGLYNVTGMTG